MTANDFEEFFHDDDSLEQVKLDFAQIKSLLPSYSNEKLCEMIMCDRYFGFGQRIDLMCMEELAKRRAAGDTFDFESYIDQQTKEMPVINLKTPDLREVLQQAMAQIKKSK